MKQNELKSFIYLTPLILVVFIPFIVFGRVTYIDGEYYRAWTGETVIIDFFSFYKSVFLISVGFFLACLSVVAILDRFSKTQKTLLVFVILYVLFISFSLILSEYPLISLFGMIDRYEGSLVLFSYASILYSTSVLLNDKRMIIWTLRFILIACFMLSIIGILQFFRYDPLSFEPIATWIYPFDQDVKLPFLSSHVGRVDITMYNSNYVGSFASLFFPLTFFMFLNEKRNSGFIYLFINLMLFTVLLVSKSRAGLLGSLVGVGFVFFVLRNKKHNIWKFLIMIPYLIIFVSLNTFSSNSIVNKFSTILPGVEEKATSKNSIHIDYIDFNDNIATLVTSKGEVKLRVSENVEWINNDNQPIFTQKYFSKNVFYLSDVPIYFKTEINDKYTNVYTELNQIYIIFVYIDGKLHIHNARNQLVSAIPDVESCCFVGKENIASTRGYIWSRAIPMLRKSLFIGYGADTFSANFPQDDIVGKLNVYNKTQILIDKPHNYYLQVIHDTGLASLFVLLTIFFLYIKQATNLIVVSNSPESVMISSAVMSGIVGYLTAGFFNDSVVHVAPLFWLLLGTGYAVNKVFES